MGKSTEFVIFVYRCKWCGILHLLYSCQVNHMNVYFSSNEARSNVMVLVWIMLMVWIYVFLYETGCKRNDFYGANLTHTTSNNHIKFLWGTASQKFTWGFCMSIVGHLDNCFCHGNLALSPTSRKKSAWNRILVRFSCVLPTQFFNMFLSVHLTKQSCTAGFHQNCIFNFPPFAISNDVFTFLVFICLDKFISRCICIHHGSFFIHVSMEFFWWLAVTF